MAFRYILLFLIIIVDLDLGLGVDEECKVVKCGRKGPAIRFPFRLEDKQPQNCGYPGFELSCNSRKQTVLQLPVGVPVVIKRIDYLLQRIEVEDSQKCFPAQLHRLNLSASVFIYNEYSEIDFAFFNCSPTKRVSGNSAFLVPCLGGRGYEIYADNYIGGYLSEELTSCVKIANFLSVPYTIIRSPRELLPLRWLKPNCYACPKGPKGRGCRWMMGNQTQCIEYPKTASTTSRTRLFAALGVIVVFLAVITLYFTCSSLKRLQEDQVKVQRFLKDYKAFKPNRYSYYDIKMITNNFKEKLGVGAFGTVFKGKLSNEIFVAVKLLQSSLENGAEFIKEVGTMATIHHANVVRLVGFCADGVKHALIYEFCPNESLEKFIFSENSNFLGWERLQEIALGIARGIEYLHHGCDSQILHFDIKPQNILLDHNFNPKIADFGLAKLCPKDQSKVSMTKARGTMGYIAPEVFSRNFGNVSDKSDVFSFGMLLLEMVSGRKVDSTAKNNTRTYFPEIIYDRICRGDDIQDGGKIAKKIAIVGLWCIQWSPPDRPSMKTAVQMLEAEVETLPIPPNPFAKIDSINKPARKFNTELDVISEEVYLLNHVI